MRIGSTNGFVNNFRPHPQSRASGYIAPMRDQHRALLLAFVLPRLHHARGRYWWAFMTLFGTFSVFVGTFLWIFFY